jgi:hypothetical protein
LSQKVARTADTREWKPQKGNKMSRISTNNGEDFEDSAMRELRKREELSKYDKQDPLGTRTQLEGDFMKFLEKKMPNIRAGITRTASADSELSTSIPNVNAEKLLSDLYEVYDGLIDSVNGMAVNSTSKNIAKQINKVGSCIASVGGKVDAFDLLSCVSGLQMPDQSKNVERVIENTKQAYSLGKISDAVVVGNKAIKVAFTGSFMTRKGEALYKATGIIKAKRGWTGNEAIDFIHTLGEGRMSVKMSEGDRWVDKSDDYDIEYSLQEWLASEVIKPQPKKEEVKLTENNANKGNNDSKVEVIKAAKVVNKTESVVAKADVATVDEDLNFPIVEKENSET